MTALWLAGAAVAGPEWVVDPRSPGPDVPPVGRSLFDHLVGAGPVPFPLEDLLAGIEATLDPDAYLDRPVKRVLIPLCRSLQREAGAPAFFRFPRAVAAVDGEPLPMPGEGRLLLRDRLYIGYLEKANVLEVVSYNEKAARFEFQVVRDYRDGGERRVSYAPRALCTACHQNASPIFARPLWDETNANDRVAGLLTAEGRDFYGFPVDLGVDVAYATDRANGFVLTQRLWQEGCGSGEAGRRCRAGLTVAALQRVLSGDRRAHSETSTQWKNLVEQMRITRAKRWPDGLLLPDSDIPNRKPLERVALLNEPVAEVPQAANLFGESSIPSHFEPLAPRPAAETWNPPHVEWARRAVWGLSEFLARPDARRLDAHLRDRPAPETELKADCQVRESFLEDGGRRLKLACQGAGLALLGRIFQETDGRLTGRLAQVRIGGTELGALVLSGQELQGRFVLTPGRPQGPLSPRLSDGSALASLELTWMGNEKESGRMRTVVREDFRPVLAATESMLREGKGAFDQAPFQRALVLSALFERLGMEPLTWCCLDDDHLPPPETESAEVGLEAPELQPFYQVCARCHRTGAPFPPNFLAGSPEEVRTRVGQCAERIAFRLGMWELDSGNRPKTPMPPQYILPALGTTPEDWPDHPVLGGLRGALLDLSKNRGDSVPPWNSC